MARTEDEVRACNGERVTMWVDPELSRFLRATARKSRHSLSSTVRALVADAWQRTKQEASR